MPVAENEGKIFVLTPAQIRLIIQAFHSRLAMLRQQADKDPNFATALLRISEEAVQVKALLVQMEHAIDDNDTVG